ncbi:hypothetical protein OAS21_02910 [Pelagibacteraceae bacterium]|nr:hypothetical protein [Pelagibacteraceae bacterium]
MKNKIINYLNIFIIFIVSFFANFYFGSIGVFPIDSFAFFDSANFINKGFLPIRDFWTSNGFLVDLIQSVFFKLFGVSWFSYLLHPSLLNFLFALFTYQFLKKEGLNVISALFYSVSVSLLAYPSAGVPFPDHHSLILSIISMYLLIYGFKSHKNIIWVCIPPVLFAAFLCKQIPASFFIIVSFCLIIFESFLNKNFSKFLPLILSSIITLSIFILFLKFSNTDFRDFLIQYIYFPLTIGEERSLGLNIKSIFLKLITDFKFFLIIGLILIFEIIKEIYIRKDKINYFFDTEFIVLLVSLIAIFNQLLMKNQNIIFFILPILLGITHIRIVKKYNKNFFLLIIIILLNIFITTKYHYRFNIDRKFMELENINKTILFDAKKISPKLKGLKWTSLNKERGLNNETQLLEESINYLRLNKGNSLIVTSYQFILSEIDHQFYSPNRWYTNDGISYPLNDNKFYSEYKKFFKNKLLKYGTKIIFTVGTVNDESFNFVMKKDCIRTKKINEILYEHKLLNCIINKE